ncbi:hypothetical protein CXB72_00140 [Lactobacillus acidophilus]|uniref:Uncharacterized protein n=1 Tax=Lactobacillus amylovorus subsp. animalium TaxID=3378536 RepID=A0ABC9VMM6_LACAM|nr:hypothetical protein [Lactobacillus acidophilus]AZN75678.1 hypothetical protein CXB72_00140 [Lactobacillus acidophilus]
MKKAINYTNGITYFLTRSQKSYSSWTDDIQDAISDLKLSDNFYTSNDFDLNEKAKRIYLLSKGIIPTIIETKALAYILFENEKSWPKLYYPNLMVTKKSIAISINSCVLSIWKGEKDFNTWLSKQTSRSLNATLPQNLFNNHHISLRDITKIYLGLLDRRRQEDIYLGFQVSDTNLVTYSDNFISQIPENAPIIYKLMPVLRASLEINRGIKKEQKLIIFQQLISVLQNKC